MKAIPFAAAVLAASAVPALAGEGNYDAFAQNPSGPTLSGPSRNYVASLAEAPARFTGAVPAYARLLPGNANMAGPETPNSLPVGAAAVFGRIHARCS